MIKTSLFKSYPCRIHGYAEIVRSDTIPLLTTNSGYPVIIVKMLSRKRKENDRLRVKMESNPSDIDGVSCKNDDEHSIISPKDAEDLNTIEKGETSTTKTKLTLEEKTRLIDDLASNKNINDILCQYKLSRSSLNSVLNKRNDTKGSSSKTVNKNVNPLFKILEKRILDWVRNANKRKKSFNAKVLQKKAREIAEDLGIAAFKRSTTWVERLKARNKEVVSTSFVYILLPT